MNSLQRAASVLPKIAISRVFDPASSKTLSRLLRLQPFTLGGSGHFKAVAAVPLAPNTVINTFRAPVSSHATMHTICLGAGTHVAPTHGAEFISHACSGTNVKVVVAGPAVGMLVVTKHVAAGEDLSFKCVVAARRRAARLPWLTRALRSYETSEWALSCPFECACPSCLASGTKRVVRGFAVRCLRARARTHTRALRSVPD